LPKITKIICDNCEDDLTTTGNSIDYRLALICETKQGYGRGPYTDLIIYPPIDRNYYFCDLACLDQWREKKKP
jgi:hypothetical protein